MTSSGNSQKHWVAYMAVESLEILRPLTPIFFFALLGSLENDPLSSACLLSQIQVDQEITVRVLCDSSRALGKRKIKIWTLKIYNFYSNRFSEVDNRRINKHRILQWIFHQQRGGSRYRWFSVLWGTVTLFKRIWVVLGNNSLPFLSNGEGNGNPPSILAWRMLGQRTLVACHLWGRTESDTTEAT